MDKQVWHFDDSPVATLAGKLPEGFIARPAPRQKSPRIPKNGQVWLADYARDSKDLEKLARRTSNLRVVYLTKTNTRLASNTRTTFAYLPARPPASVLARTLESAFESNWLATTATEAKEQLKRSLRDIRELNRIGVALSSEKDPDKLLDLILLTSREITSSDAGSLYLVEEISDTEKRLRFKLTQTDSLDVGFTEFTIPINRSSIAGYVADTGEVLEIPDAYKISPESPFQFNRDFDQKTGYRTKSMLTIPLKNPKGEVLGVLQLINCKRSFQNRLQSPKDFESAVTRYQESQVDLATSLASQAAVAYENSILYENIQNLFEGFVKAAVTAIEQRDPTTSGHSFRVSRLTCGLAEAVDKTGTGPCADLNFTRDQMKEIRYAALLHDFGKVGVREEILVKAKKLYPDQLNVIRNRFDYIRKELEVEFIRRQMEAIQKGQPPEVIASLDSELQIRLAEVDDYMQFILECNEPTVLPEGNFGKLIEVAKRSYVDPRGIERPYVTPEEVRFLSIPKGSLDPDERLQIESHVIHTYNFLTQIPWTKEIKNIPAIARGHHEKLDGSGYPYKLAEAQIPPQTRMMTISDMFDALSAADRPYKKALSAEKSLNILTDCVKQGQLDTVLFQLFLDAKIYQLTKKNSTNPPGN